MDQATSVTLQELGARIIDLCGRMHGAECQLLDLIRQLDELHPWDSAMPSCAHWLVWRCGMDIVTAREKVRVARALASLPQISEHFRTGELSYSKVRALTRVAEPDTEAEWLEAGLRHTAAQLERIVRQHRQTHCVDGPGAALEAWKQRHLEYRIQDDGSLSFEGRVPAEVGAMLVQALDRALEWMDQEVREAGGTGNDSAESHRGCCGVGGAVDAADAPPHHDTECASGGGNHCEPRDADRASAEARDEGGESSADASAESSWLRAAADAGTATATAAMAERPSLAARRADALGLLAERFLAVAPEADAGLQSADRYLLTVHAPIAALPLRAQVDPSDPPRVEQGPVLAQETIRRIGCDAALVRILESGDGEPLDVGRKTRLIPPAMRRALMRRDGGCRFPGCTHTKFVDGHHIVHWADGGETRLDNLVSVCRHHHRLLHEGGYTVVKRGADFLFFRPDGVQVAPVNDRLQPGELEAELGKDVTGLGPGSRSAAVSVQSVAAGSGSGPAWRLPAKRGFNRTGSWQRAEWEAYVMAMRR